MNINVITPTTQTLPKKMTIKTKITKIYYCDICKKKTNKNYVCSNTDILLVMYVLSIKLIRFIFSFSDESFVICKKCKISFNKWLTKQRNPDNSDTIKRK